MINGFKMVIFLIISFLLNMLVVILLRSTFSHELGINKPQFFLQRNSKCLSLIIHFLLNVQNNGHLQWGNSCFCFLTPLLLPPTTTPHLMFLYYHYELMNLYLPNALYSFTVIILSFSDHVQYYQHYSMHIVRPCV